MFSKLNANFTREYLRSNSDWLILSGLIVLNLIVKLIFVTYPDIGGDEPFSLFYANADISEYLAIIQSENNPPFYIFLLKIWVKIFGISPLSVRMLSVIFSSLSAGIIFQLGRKYFSFRIGLLTALLFTFASYHMEFAHQARVYALFGFLTMASMYAYLRLVVDKRNRNAYYLVFFNILLIYSHFFGVFVLLIQFLSALFIKEIRSSKMKVLVIGWIITFASFLPYITITLFRFSNSVAGTWQAKAELTDLYNNLWNFSNQPVNTIIFLSILLTAFILYILKKRKPVSTQVKIILIWFFVPYFLMFFASFYVPMFLYRYLIFISFGYYFLISISLASITTNKVFTVISALLIGMMIFTCNFKAGNNLPDKKIVESIKNAKGKNTAVLLCPQWHYLLFSYHYDITIFKDSRHIISRLEDEHVYPLFNLTEDAIRNIEERDTIIYLDAWDELTDSELSIQNYLDKNLELIRTPDVYNGIRVSYYRNYKKQKGK